MPSYTDPFGGSSVQPADVSYRAVVLSANVVLSWPWLATDSNYVARILDVTPSTGSLTVTMPDARLASNGADTVFFNPGSQTFTVLGATGATICTVPAGQAQYVYLKSNATQAGSWGSVQFASLASAVTAASLVGPGIAASGAALYSTMVVSTKSTNYTVVAADRTKVFAWTGGLGTLTLPASASAGNDFFCAVSNRGTGTLTVAAAGADLIDGVVSIALGIGESCFVHCSGAAFYTVGRGRSTQFNFTLLSKAISTGTYTLTLSEAQNTIHKYTGALVANVQVVLPSTVQVYYITNLTTGVYSITFKTAGVGTTVAVSTGQSVIVFCDGLNVVNVSAGVLSSTQVIVNPGSAAAPGYTFTGDLTSGFFEPAAGSIGTSISGVEATRLTSTGLGVGGTAAFKLDVFGTSRVSGAATFSSTVGITGNTTVGGTLGVTGALTASSTLAVTSNATVGGTLGVTGVTTVGGTFGVTGALTASSTLAVTGNSTVGGTLGITGALTASSTLAVTSNATVGGTLGVTGVLTAVNVTVGGTLGVTGAATLNSTLAVAGVITAAAGVSGNASTATALQTARTINGTSFNGSANITISSASDFIGANQSLAATGYQKLPGGFIMQWGVYTTTATISFPIAFQTACVGVFTGQTNGGGGSTNNVTAYNYTTSQFDLVADTNERPGKWFAIGY